MGRLYKYLFEYGLCDDFFYCSIIGAFIVCLKNLKVIQVSFVIKNIRTT